MQIQIHHRSDRCRWGIWLIAGMMQFFLSSSSAQDWPTFRGNALHTGFSPITTDTLLSTVAWKLQTGGAIHASPVVSNGRVFVASTDNHVYALDARNGNLIWRQQLGQWIESTPVVSQGKVIIAAMDHKVYALDESTGRIDWIFATASWLEASPVAGEGLVFIAGLDGYLYALEVQTGRERWRFNVHTSIFSSPALAAGVLYFGVQDTLYAVDTGGRLQWKSPTGNGTIIESAPAVHDGNVIVSTIDNGVAYHQRTGQHGSFDNQILTFDTATGSPRWTYTVEPYGLMHSSPAIAYGRIFMATDRGRLYALDLLSGNQIWQIDTPDSGAVWASPAVAAGVVYVATYKGHLYGFSAESGILIDAFSLPSAGSYFHASPAISGNHLYGAGSDGMLYALAPSTPSAVQAPVETPPGQFTLAQNHPNPVLAFSSNPATKIAFQLPRDSHVVLKVYNLLGAEVAILLNERRSAGLHQVEFDASKLPSGLYLYQLKAGKWGAVRKMVVR
jgi:outer membrane protein assembly factor BamB